MKYTHVLAVVAGAAIAATLLAEPTTAGRPGRAAAQSSSPVKRVSTLVNDGGRLDWSSKNVIAFDRKGKDGYFDIYLLRPGSGDERCLTCDRPELPNRQIGQPAWHPDGVWLAFQAQRGGPRGLPALTDFFADPGAGIANDVWMTNGEKFWQLTNVPRGYGGVLHPQFSHDGRQLLWAERVGAKGGKWGQWALKIRKDFSVDNGTPRLNRTRTLAPGRQQRFYESHGFSKDSIAASCSRGNLSDGQDETGLDIYWLDLGSNQLTNLTNSPDVWDEHAHLSPGGGRIVWMSTRDLIEGPIDPVKMRGGLLDHGRRRKKPAAPHVLQSTRT